MDNFSEYSEAIVLGKAAKILSKHMLDHKSTFDGTFNDSYIEGWIPSCLLQFVGMIEHVADIKSPLKFALAYQRQIWQLLNSCIITTMEDTQQLTDRQSNKVLAVISDEGVQF